MTDSLTGARLKLLRAREHLEVLGDELAAFRAEEPYRVAHEEKAEGSEHVFRAQVVKEPPPFLSILIGDALQNMRSTLEHLAWGLTPQNTRDISKRSIGFPICRTSQAFEQTASNSPSGYDPRSGGMHKIWTMDNKVRAAIHQLQPYYTGRNDLLILNELARVDRHQSLRLMGGFNMEVSYGWCKRGTRDPFEMVPADVRETRVTFGGDFEHDAVIGHFRFNKPEMEVYFQVTPYVAFRDEGIARGEHVLRTLTEMHRHIERVVIPKLERYF